MSATLTTTRTLTPRGQRLNALAARCQAGDESAFPELVEAAWGLVKTVSRSYLRRGHDPDDLDQCGRIGLWEAVQAWQPDRGAFTMTAKLYIHKQINLHIRDAVGVARIPAHRLNAALGNDQYSRFAEAALAPTVADLDGLACPAPTVADRVAVRETAEDVQSVLSDLPPMWRDTLLRHVAQSESSVIVGREWGVTPQRVRYLARSACCEFRRRFEAMRASRQYQGFLNREAS